MASDPKGLGAKFDAHTDAEFNTRDIEATMATMGTLPYVTHVPTMTGGAGYDAVRHFYENYFVGRVPDDWSVKLISRTIGESQLVDEVLISFTHDCDIPALLPGVKPTRRKVTIPFVVVVGFDKDEKVVLRLRRGLLCFNLTGCL
jgi:carboxymethylenebutenolidase